MKIIVAVFLSFFYFGYSQNKVSKMEQNSIDKFFATKLIENDFLKFANQSKLDSLKNEMLSDFNIYNYENNKIAHIDAEELAEFNFDFFVPELNKILSKRNFKLELKIAEDVEITNSIYINGEKIRLYSKEQLDDYSYGDIAPRVFFKKMNELLIAEGIEEKFYLLYGGNDLNVMFLTEKQYVIIAERYKNNKNEIPYLP